MGIEWVKELRVQKIMKNVNTQISLFHTEAQIRKNK